MKKPKPSWDDINKFFTSLKDDGFNINTRLCVCDYAFFDMPYASMKLFTVYTVRGGKFKHITADINLKSGGYRFCNEEMYPIPSKVELDVCKELSMEYVAKAKGILAEINDKARILAECMKSAGKPS